MLGCLTHVKQANHFKQFDMGTYVRTLETLGFKNSDFESWMPEAKNRDIWSTRVEYFLNLPPDKYTRSNAKCVHASLRTYTN